MLVLMQCCRQEVAMKGNGEGIERRAAYGSPLHAPGGSPTPCVSSRIFLRHPKPPPPTRAFVDAKKQPTSLVEGRGWVVAAGK
jgi:hypothetical protein